MWHRTPIPDLLIAGTALHNGLGVVHVDGDHQRGQPQRRPRHDRLRHTPRGAVPLASDDFARTVSNGWASADVGGPYSFGSGTSSNFAVDGSVGTMQIPTPGPSRFASLLDVSARDVDLSVNVGSDKASTGSYGQLIQLVARRFSHNTEYRARLRVAPNGNLYVSMAKALSSSESLLTAEVAVAGVTFSPPPRTGCASLPPAPAPPPFS